MDVSRRDFVRRACVGVFCFCGFGRMTDAQAWADKDEHKEDASSDDLPQLWIREVLANLDADLNEEECRRIVKSAFMAHYATGKMEELLAPYRGKPDEFIRFLEKEWGWKCRYEDGRRTL